MSETDKTTTPPSAVEQRLAEALEAVELVDEEATTGSAQQPTSRPPDLQVLQTELEHTQAKAAEYWQLYVQARADADNIRRRTERELANAHKFALEGFVKELLPVKDSLEMGAAASNPNADVAQVKQGVDLTLKMLVAAMAKFGVEEVDPLGDKFNPDLHAAMGMQPSDEVAPNTVLHVVQKGYLLNQRLVRPAMVMVAKATEKSPSES